MGWHLSLAMIDTLESSPSSQGPAAGSSVGFFVDSEQSERLRSIRTAERSCFEGKRRRYYRRSLSGMTYEPSTAALGVERWISSLRASRASPSARPAGDEGRTTAGTSGRTPSASFARWDRDSRSWRTCHTFWPMTISAKSSEGWRKQGSMRNGELFPRRPLEHRTSESDSGYLPTPTVSQAHWYRRRGKKYPSLAGMARTGMWPTPTASDATKGCASRYHGNGSHTLSSKVGGRLNPTFVEWLMSFPSEWTALEPSETRSARQWLEKHGGGC